MLLRSIVACYATRNNDALWEIFEKTLIVAGLTTDRNRHKLGEVSNRQVTQFQDDFWYRSVREKIIWFAELLSAQEGDEDFVICSDIDIGFPASREQRWTELAEYGIPIRLMYSWRESLIPTISTPDL